MDFVKKETAISLHQKTKLIYISLHCSLKYCSSRVFESLFLKKVFIFIYFFYFYQKTDQVLNFSILHSLKIAENKHTLKMKIKEKKLKRERPGKKSLTTIWSSSVSAKSTNIHSSRLYKPETQESSLRPLFPSPSSVGFEVLRTSLILSLFTSSHNTLSNLPAYY